MPSILETLADRPVRQFTAGEIVLDQGDRTGLLYFLIEGSVEVVKDEVVVATASRPGDVFGDLAALLDVPHTAAVRTTKESRFYVVEGGREYLERTPAVAVHLCELLARRLDSLNKYLVDVKRQYAGDDRLGMVDDVLDTLMHRHPRPRVAPKAQTLRDPQVLD